LESDIEEIQNIWSNLDLSPLDNSTQEVVAAVSKELLLFQSRVQSKVIASQLSESSVASISTIQDLQRVREQQISQVRQLLDFLFNTSVQ
jgi:hypothetical protein